MQYADIIIDRPLSQSDLLTYSILPQQLPFITIGSVVLVPLGKTRIHGVIVRLRKTVPASLQTRLRPIHSLIYPGQFVPFYLIKSVFELKKQYGYPLNETLFRLLPSLPKRPQSELGSISPKTRIQPSRYSYSLNDNLRAQLYLSIWSRFKDKGLSILFLCSSLESHDYFKALFEEHGIPLTLFPRESIAEKRRYYLLSRTSSEPRVFLGTRSALLTPLETVGAVIIDEPWLPGHKDDRSPRWWTAMIAHVLCQNSQAHLILGSAFPWPETSYFQPNFKTSPQDFNNFHLVAERTPEEVVAFINSLEETKKGELVLFINPVKLLMYWCQNCQQIGETAACTKCSQVIEPVSSWTEEFLKQRFSKQINIYLFNQIIRFKEYDAIAVFNFDALLSITDYRARLYLMTLLAQMSNRSYKIYLITRRSEAWTALINSAKSYDFNKELFERRELKLPPFSYPAIIHAASPEQGSKFCQSIESSILYRGEWQKNQNGGSLFVLLDPKQPLNAAHFQDKSVTIDLFPSYIE